MHYGADLLIQVAFQSAEAQLDSIDDAKAATGPVGITIDGTGVREVPGPTGIPYFGNFFEIYPDHLGNNQRLFTKCGPIFRSRTLGTKVLETNDPKIALIAFSETPFFSKISNSNQPLYPIKDDNAGVFLSDTDNESWKIVHNFMPPALGRRP